MAGKRERQALIRRLVAGGGVATQRELIRGLRRRGLAVQQSTLSRDLAELGIRKIAGRYLLPGGGRRGDGPADYAGFVRRFTTCGPHLIVVTTATGQAQPVAVAIDGKGDPAIVATLAGDDTVFVATRSRRTQAVALRRLEQWFGDKHER